MAINSTIYKIDLQISDLDRHYYQQHSLTIAKHPSETDERVMVRLIAFAMYANEMLTFGKGLSDDEEPDLWQKDLTGAISLWIEVGLPTEKDIRKAAGRAKQVVIVLYGGKVADMWWAANSKGLLKINNLTVLNLTHTKELANIAERGLSMACTIQDEQIMLSHAGGTLDIIPMTLKKSS